MDGLHLGFATGLKVSNTIPAYVGCMDYKQPALPTPATARSIKACSFLNIFFFLQKPSLLLELMVLFRTKRFFSLWRVNRWVSNLQEKILIQKSQVLHIFAWLCSTPVGPHPHFSFPQNDLPISSTRLSWKQFSTWYIVCVSLLWLCWWHRLDTCYGLGNG